MKHLKIMTCGSVDDGKSTLLGRFIFETGNLNYDQSEYLKRLNQKYGKEPDKIDYSLLVDGLIDEKEQGITIDLAFKYLILNKTQITLIDSPGHVEYTKNMACAASIANVALVLVDITKGITKQTKKHLEIINYFSNIQEIIICINKLDKINYNKKEYTSLTSEISEIIDKNNYKVPIYVPISALEGENVVSNSKKMNNYSSTNLLEVIHKLKIKKERIKNQIGIVRDIDLTNSRRRYLVDSQSLSVDKGEELHNIFTGEKTKVKEIYSGFHRVSSTKDQKNVVLELSKEISIAKGDILSTENYSNQLTDSFKGKVIWCSNTLLETSKNYIFQFENKEIGGFISKVNDRSHFKNEIFDATIELNEKNLLTKGSEKVNNFLVIDPYTNESLGFGFCLYSLDRGKNIHNKQINNTSLTPAPCLWLTGLPASGKTTIATELSIYLHKMKINNFILDGDNLRKTINKDLGFSKSDRFENNRRVAHIAKIISKTGTLPIVATVSPAEEIRNFAKEIIGENFFHLLYIKASIEECIKRDPKNLYKSDKKIKNLTGVGEAFETPLSPDLLINTEKLTIKQSLDMINNYLKSKTTIFD